MPETRDRALDLAQAFGRVAPLEVDLGCGDGTFLATLAREQPGRNFLGVDWTPSRVRAACRKIGDAHLPNARVLRADNAETLCMLLAPQSVEVCHLLFSDPWPKRRHHERRVFSERFLRAVAHALVPSGLLRVATDHAEYFSAMARIWPLVREFEVCPADEGETGFSTTFEERFRASGARINRVVLRKCGN
ncbi:MAG: methyltransferase domain-containing protein [Chthoniobacterales bacterium]